METQTIALIGLTSTLLSLIAGIWIGMKINKSRKSKSKPEPWWYTETKKRVSGASKVTIDFINEKIYFTYNTRN